MITRSPRARITIAVAAAATLCAGAAHADASSDTVHHAAHHAEQLCPKPSGLGQDVAPGAGRTVALTFDDGPGASTRQILDILRAQHVTATFFNLGENEVAQPALVRTEARDGFALGDHTWDHTDLTTLDAAGQAREIDRERAEQAKLTGHESCLFRPPYGSSDATTADVATARHMAIWDWSVDTEDWKADGSSDAYWVHRIVRRADAGADQMHPVILMHNQPGGNPATVTAVSRVIRYYRAHGYAFVDVLGDTGAPVVSSLSTAAGPTAGGRRIVIHGSNFRDVTAVRFGREAATDVVVRSTAKIVATVPARHDGPVYVTVASGDHGTSGHTDAARYRYVAPPTVTAVGPRRGPAAGGRKIRLTGTGFVDVVRVRFGGVRVVPNRVIGSTRIWLTTPAHAAGTVDITVRTKYYSTTPTPADRYRFLAG